jgi:glycosyltransferase involved in cell wall biosynthesis
MQQEFSLLKPAKSIVIPNGYDEKDVVGQDIPLDERFSISHIGTMNAARNPDVIWRALSNLVNRNTSLKRDLIIQLIGKVDFLVTESITQYGLQDKMLKIDYLPHAEAILKQQSSQLLLLIINRSANAKGILTGKFFEYLASGRPILGVGPSDGDAADILNRCEAGKMVDFEDVESAEKYLAACYQLYQEKKLKNEIKSVEQYSRKHLTGQLAALLNQLTAHA